MAYLDNDTTFSPRNSPTAESSQGLCGYLHKSYSTTDNQIHPQITTAHVVSASCFSGGENINQNPPAKGSPHPAAAIVPWQLCLFPLKKKEKKSVIGVFVGFFPPLGQV